MIRELYGNRNVCFNECKMGGFLCAKSNPSRLAALTLSIVCSQIGILVVVVHISFRGTFDDACQMYAQTYIALLCKNVIQMAVERVGMLTLCAPGSQTHRESRFAMMIAQRVSSGAKNWGFPGLTRWSENIISFV